MTDPIEIVKIAMASTPPMDDASEWRRAVGERIPEVARALDPDGALAKRAVKMIDGRWLRGVITAVHLETNSTRGYIEFVATVGKPKKPGEDPTEHFRTERTDDPDAGGAALWDAIQDWVGWECEFWLYTEVISADQKVRVVQWFNPLRKADQSKEEPVPQSGTLGRGQSIVDKLNAEYGGMAAARYAKAIREELGVTNPLNPDEKDMELCRAIARRIAEAEEARRG